MDPSPDLDLHASPVRPNPKVSVETRLRQAAERGVVWLHRQADRLDLVPSEFGNEAQVDEANATSLVREWWRQLKLWMAYNPEEMLAIKAGAAALGVALVILVVIVGALT